MWRDRSLRERIVNIVFGLLAAAGVTLSCKIYCRAGLWSLPADCYFLPMNGKLVLTFLVSFLAAEMIFAGVIRLGERLADGQHKQQEKGIARETGHSFRVWLVSFAVIVACWLPYLLSHFPGGIFSDTQTAITEALAMDTQGWHGIYNHNPIMYTLMIRLCILTSRRFFDGSIQTAITILTLFQFFFMAAVMALFPCWLYRHGCNVSGSGKAFCRGIILWEALFPLYPLYAVSNWKDTLFGGYMFLYVLCLLDYLYAGIPYEEGKNKRHAPGSWYLRYILASLLVCFGRNNGKYIVFFVTAVLLIREFCLSLKGHGRPQKSNNTNSRQETDSMEGKPGFPDRKRSGSGQSRKPVNKKETLRLAAVFLSLFVGVQLITGPLYDSMDYNRDNITESVAVPVQQMAAVVYYDGVMSEENHFYMNMLLPERTIKAAYVPQLFDSLKFIDDPELPGLQSYIIRDYPERFVRNYLSMFVHNPMICLKAWLLETCGFWSWTIQDDNDIAVMDAFADSEYDLTCTDYIERWTGIPMKQILNRTVIYKGGGVYFWILFFAIFVCLYHKDRKGLLILLPGFLLWATIMVATPIAQSVRYIYPLIMYLPVDLMLILRIPYFSETKQARQSFS